MMRRKVVEPWAVKRQRRLRWVYSFLAGVAIVDVALADGVVTSAVRKALRSANVLLGTGPTYFRKREAWVRVTGPTLRARRSARYVRVHPVVRGRGPAMVEFRDRDGKRWATALPKSIPWPAGR